MDYDDILVIQKKFAKFHRLFVLVLFTYCLNAYINHKSKVTLYLMIVIVIFLVAEYFILLSEDVKLFDIGVLRFMQIFVVSFQLIRIENVFAFGIILLCLILFSIEYFCSMDFLDVNKRIFFYVTTGLALFAMAILKSILIDSMDDELFVKTLFILVFMILSFHLCTLLSNYVQQTVNQIFRQARLIDDINHSKEVLISDQEKVKKINELLGVQKIKLEAAYDEINRVNSEMMIQDEIVKYISSSLEIENLMTLITESIINQIGADVCTIVIYPETMKDSIKYKIRTKLGKDYETNLSQFVEDKCFEDYLEGNKVYLNNHVKELEYSFNREGILGSFIIVPLVKKEKKIGALFVGHTKYDYFDNHTSFFQVIVAQFLIAINNANIYTKMEHMAITDGLTGIYNRRHLTERFNESLNEALINRTSLTVALFDIDKFKNVNDTYGHLFGDVVIQTIAELAQQTAKDNNGILGRYGGEEFVIIFPNKGLKEAHKAVQLMHYKIKNKELSYNGEPVHVSVSLGLTSFPQTCRNPAELLNRADWAMYYAKENGRDLIIIDRNDIREHVLLK